MSTKMTYHIQYVYIEVSYQILKNKFCNKMEKLNLKTDGLMLMVYIKKLMKFEVLFRASTGKQKMEHVTLGIFN